jgi:hypothetical protein
VPRSTIHYWSRHELLAPAVSAERVKLWSYADLMGLRIIYWLRQRKTDAAGAEIPPTSMKVIRRALDRLRKLDAPLWDDQASVWVDGHGNLHVKGPAGPETLAGQTLVAEGIERPLVPEIGHLVGALLVAHLAPALGARLGLFLAHGSLIEVIDKAASCAVFVIRKAAAVVNVALMESRA